MLNDWKSNFRTHLAIAGTLLAASFGATASASATAEIKIGNAIPYSGPAAGFSSIAKAAAAYFRKTNDDGILKEKIDFISLDDAYSPPKTVDQVRKLVEEDKVDVVFSTLGTPTNLAIWDYMNEKKVPHLFLYTGASIFADPQKHPWTVRWLPSYASEAAFFSQYIRENIKDPKIAVLYQNDAFGKDFLDHFRKSLGKDADRLIVAEQSYQTTDPTVDSQILKLKDSGANVLMHFSIGRFTAQSIKKVHSLGWNPTQFVSGVASSVKSVLAPAGLDASKGIVSCATFKSPSDPRWANDPAMKDYFSFMTKYYPDGDPKDDFALQGVLEAQMMVHVLKQAGTNLSRENILHQAISMKAVSLPLLIPGITVSSSSTDYNLLKQLQPVRFDGEKWVSFGKLIDTSRVAQ